ncbi:MAG TPA: PQQ-binding-like beta-propeller repeat protein [Dehalococcoidia bacterium]|nr:PQQ-binding-like beta-propeller repeat protein [Dehalococcoidia bacterium]
MKQRRFLGLIAVLGLLGLLLTGCGRAGAHGWAPPVANGDVRYFATGAGHFDALSDATKLWRFPTDWNIPDSKAGKLKGIYGMPVPSNDGKTVFVGDYNGYLYAFRPADHTPNAQIEPNAASLKLNGPVIGGLAYDPASDMIYVSSDKQVFAVKASEMAARIDNRDAPVTHSVFYTTGDQIWARPVVADGKVLIASLDGNLYAVDQKTDTLAWTYNSSRGLVTTPVISGDLALIGGFDDTLTAINVADGSVKWSYKASNWVWSRPVVANGVAYFGDFDGVLHAVNVADGSEEWTLDLGKGSMRSGPAIAGNDLVVAGDHGWLFGVDVTTKQKIWQKDLKVSMLADLVTDGSKVLVAPTGCVTPAGQKQKVYYTSVDPTNGNLTSAPGVC